MVYAIYEDFYPDVEKKLNRIAKKCVKHGNNFTFNIIGNEIREYINNDTKRIEYYKFILVEVEGTARIDNWECVAVLENNNYGNIIRRINTEIEIPDRFKYTKNICEHCNYKRFRNNLFVIHNVETNEWKQVGGSCLKLYTCGLNMEFVTTWIDGITELEEFDGFIGNGGKNYYNVKDVLCYAVEIIEKIGYFNSNSNLPTKHLVTWLACFDIDTAIHGINRDLTDAKIEIRFNSKDFYKDNTSEKVEKIIEYYNNIKDNCEFIHNVKVILKEGYVLSKNFGFLSYLPEGYTKYIQNEIKKAKRAEEITNTSYFGEVGKRYKDKVIHCVNTITSWETQFGTTYVYKIVLDDGIVLIWKTGSVLYLDRNEEFDKITFTIKGHNEYKGEKQTEVTRCKVTVKNI